MGIIVDMAAVLFRPSKIFKKIKENPKWVLPAIIIILSAVFLVVASRPAQINMALTQLKHSSQKVPPGYYAQAKKSIQSPIMTIVGAVSIAFATAVSLMIAVAFFHFLSSAWGGAADFISGLAVVAFAWSPLVVKNILAGLVSLLSGKLIAPGLAALLPKTAMITPLGAFLGSIDLFILWSLILLAVGINKVYQLSKSKAYILVFGYWFLGMALKVGLALVMGGIKPPIG